MNCSIQNCDRVAVWVVTNGNGLRNVCSKCKDELLWMGWRYVGHV